MNMELLNRYAELKSAQMAAEEIDTLLMVGDLHQSLYSFRGATQDVLGDDVFKVLDQSYRVPQAAHEMAMRIMKQMTTIEPVAFKPTDQPGAVEYRSVGYREFAAYMPEVHKAVKEGKTLMILAPCGYMLNKVVTMLRNESIPFHNPFAKKMARWNPLSPKLRKGSVATATKFILYLRGRRGYWQPEELLMMLDIFSNCWRHGGKADVKRAQGVMTYGPKELKQLGRFVMKPEAHAAMEGGCENPQLILPYVVPKYRDLFGYMVGIHKQFGEAGLTQEPKIIPGTIHSVKGGEAELISAELRLFIPVRTSGGMAEIRSFGYSMSL